MNSGRAPRRRFKVVARPQARARRAKLLAAGAAVLILGAIAAAALRDAASALAKAKFANPLSSSGPEAAVVDGVAEPFLSLAQAAADAVNGGAGDKAAAIKSKFACVADVSLRRSWGEKRTTLTPVLRGAVAPVLRRGRPAGYLSSDGLVFDAPAGVYSLPGPSADAAGASDAELKALAREWPALSAPSAFPAPLSELAYRSAEEGWEARLTDGTVVQWGRLEWTKEKLARLTEAVADAKTKAVSGAFAADLRWFEDGKVLLKPLPLPAPAVAARGGSR